MFGIRSFFEKRKVEKRESLKRREAEIIRNFGEQTSKDTHNYADEALDYLKKVSEEYEAKMKELRRLAEQNDANAQFDLGCCYKEGEAVCQNYREAYYWWMIASANGHDEAKTQCKEIQNHLTNQQREEMQVRVKRWLDHHA